MEVSPLHILLLPLFFFSSSSSSSSETLHPLSPYLSPSTILRNYQKMLQSFNIFAYETPTNLKFPFSSISASLFHASLLQSRFLTMDPDQADLFYLYLPPGSPRSISRSIRTVRSDLPFWNRTLGADHFFISLDGIGIESDRNLVELKKNSIQISPFPTIQGRFIPHKDLTLPPLPPRVVPFPTTKPSEFLAFYNGVKYLEISTILEDLSADPEFLIGSQPLDYLDRVEKMSSSRFCLFHYGGWDQDLAVGEALALGCVPVVISGRPILDLPFSDVLRWSEIAVFVGIRQGAAGVRRAMDRTCGERYERVRQAGMNASVHFKWNDEPQPFDSFYTLMYQLWLRRHSVRYARREWS